jgi:peptidoglycan hydrolase CwlO-like protein
MRRLLRPEMKIDAGEIIILVLIIVLSSGIFGYSLNRNNNQDVVIMDLAVKVDQTRTEQVQAQRDAAKMLQQIDQQVQELNRIVNTWRDGMPN